MHANIASLLGPNAISSNKAAGQVILGMSEDAPAPSRTSEKFS